MAIPIAVGRAVGSAVGQVGIQLALEKAFFNKDVKDTVKNTESAFSKGFGNIEKATNKKFGAIGGIIKTAFAVVGVGAVTQFVKTAVQSASETQSAWTGLNSILTGTGKSFAEGKKFIDEYISDGLIPLQNAVTSYKNLASRGYSTEQIESTMLALKDAAAFGRQASYSYGEAIQSATEGLKNENSILVDNAGVTKNVAKMWDEYAKSIGTTANNLTQQQKIQAEVNGILEETKFQVGDATAYATTFAGKVAKVSTAFYNFRVAIGKFVAPIVELFLPYVEMALNALTRLFNKMAQVLKVFGLEMPDVVSKASQSISNVGTSADNTSNSIESTGDVAQKTAKKIKRAFAGIDEINVLNMPETASGTSGSGASGGSDIGAIGDSLQDITEVGEVTESLDSGAVKIANKLKELFEPLTKIDFTNLTNAFDKLKESAKPLTEKLFAGLKWLWDEVLVPFTTWTIEDAIPAFFTALAGALDFLNGVIDYAKPYLQFLWEEFLQPIAKWTGGIIVSTLKEIGDRFSIIGKWLTDNSPTIKEVRKELQPFADYLQELAKALGHILGLAWTSFKTVMIALWENGIKPIWEEFLKPLLTNLWSKMKATAEILGGIFEAFNKLMEGDWKGAGQALLNGFKDGLKELWEGSFVKKYIVDPIVNSFKSLFGIDENGEKSTLFETFGKAMPSGLRDGLLSGKTVLTIAWNKVREWFPTLEPKIVSKFETTKTNVSTWWSNVKSWWGSKNLSVGSSNSTTKTQVGKWWTTIKDWWSSKKLSIGSSNTTEKSQVSKWWTTIESWWGSRSLSIGSSNSTTKNQVTNWWNSIKSWWGNRTLSLKADIGAVTGNVKSWFNNNLIKPLNNKLPKFIPKIPYLAQGGWLKANNPQLAIVGDNKREPEIVAPESKIKQQVIEGIKEVGANNTQHFDFTIKLEYPDGRYLIKEINDTQIKDGKISLLI